MCPRNVWVHFVNNAIRSHASHASATILYDTLCWLSQNVHVCRVLEHVQEPQISRHCSRLAYHDLLAVHGGCRGCGPLSLNVGANGDVDGPTLDAAPTWPLS